MSKNLIKKMNRLALRIKDSELTRKNLREDIKFYRKKGDYKTCFKLLQKLSSRKRLQSKTRHRKVCKLTGRARGVINFFGLSKRMITNSYNKGLLMGVRRAS